MCYEVLMDWIGGPLRQVSVVQKRTSWKPFLFYHYPQFHLVNNLWQRNMTLNNRKIHLDTAYNFESQCWDIRREHQMCAAAKENFRNVAKVFCVSLSLTKFWRKKSDFQSNFNWTFYHFHFFQRAVSYNAYEKDIAIVNIFFGDSTVFGII